MEFWGLEVQPGQTVNVNPGDNKYLHLSQISLGEVKKEKGAEGASVFVKFDDKKLVLGTLSAEKCAQIQYDLVFEKEFELSHGSKNASVHFLGYKTAAFAEDDDFSDPFDSQSESDEENLLAALANGKLGTAANVKAAKPHAQKAEASVVKAKAKIEEPKKDDKPEAEDDEDDEDTEDDESDDDEDMIEGEEDDSDDGDESSDEEEEATPKKANAAKKRPAGSASKTPVPEKKAKLVTPGGNQKTGADGKKGGHVATPHPAKQGKTPSNSDKSKQQTPKSTGPISCKSCTKTFNSEAACQSHTNAKHSAGK
ncbi:histone deacetylase HDT2-like [Zingiber officinale]|uniref:histone deacetylase HDT2-like n=1 Tax=Zingiber officinale TaxID=94328 RepID=UPI001C4B50A0|nr:histone deacetylase HDT2-like [Zingiber officinale]